MSLYNQELKSKIANKEVLTRISKISDSLDVRYKLINNKLKYQDYLATERDQRTSQLQLYGNTPLPKVVTGDRKTIQPQQFTQRDIPSVMTARGVKTSRDWTTFSNDAISLTNKFINVGKQNKNPHKTLKHVTQMSSSSLNMHQQQAQQAPLASQRFSSCTLKKRSGSKQMAKRAFKNTMQVYD